MKKKKKKLFADLADKYRGAGASPPCPHFGDCGGCLFQDIPYENQLLLKKEYLNTLFAGAAKVDTMHPSDPFRYRNRMDMVAAFGRFGLRRAGSYRFVVDVESCPLMQEKSEELFRDIRPAIKNIEVYDYLRHAGYLRYAVLRQGRFTGQVMVNFVVALPDDRIGPLIEKIYDRADSISILFNDGLADQSFGDVLREIKKGYIEEAFDNTVFRITPNSFFQSNSDIALQIYRVIRENTKGRVLDLYCGVGSISIFVADRADSVTGVEQVPEAVENALINKKNNGRENVNFVCGDAVAFLKETRPAADTLILDPPRGGMNPKIIKRIREMSPETIIYMSCNPAAFRDELAGMENYRIEFFEAFDMFPQTPHVETLAVLKRTGS
jgi:tRNA (uracil-5-)-methyltransferase